MNDKRKNSSSDASGFSDKPKDANELDNQEWAENLLSQHLDKQVEDLDFNVTSRLSAARHKALDPASTGSSRMNSPSRWLSMQKLGAGVAVVAITVLIGTQLYPQMGMQPDGSVSTHAANEQSGQLIEDLNLLSASDEIEFYQSLEFLEWMASNSG